VRKWERERENERELHHFNFAVMMICEYMLRFVTLLIVGYRRAQGQKRGERVHRGRASQREKEQAREREGGKENESWRTRGRMRKRESEGEK